MDRKVMLSALEEFADLYERRPVRDNTGGMKVPHAFLAWHAMKTWRPLAIIESGVWKGQGTWLFEQACPDAELYCIDPNLATREYQSPRARYFLRGLQAGRLLGSVEHDWQRVYLEEARSYTWMCYVRLRDP